MCNVGQRLRIVRRLMMREENKYLVSWSLLYFIRLRGEGTVTAHGGRAFSTMKTISQLSAIEALPKAKEGRIRLGVYNTGQQHNASEKQITSRRISCSCWNTQAVPSAVPDCFALALAFAAASLELSVSEFCAVLCLLDTPAGDSQNSPMSAS
jgi:hypothetical protein